MLSGSLAGVDKPPDSDKSLLGGLSGMSDKGFSDLSGKLSGVGR